MTITTLPNPQELAAHGFELVQETIANNPQAIIGLTGGSTPKPLYQAIAAADLDYSQVTFVITDERYVPRDHTDSNYRMIEETLLSKIASKQVVAFDTSQSISMSLQDMHQQLPDKPIDLLFLGIGPDGHVASLFPHVGALTTKELVAHTTTDEFAIRDRLTVTPPVIMAAKQVVIIASGRKKVEILKSLVKGGQSVDAFPAMMLASHPNVTILYSQN